MVEAAGPALPTTYGALLEEPIATGEIHKALRKGARNKAPGSDSTGLEFYETNWTTLKEDLCDILNQMFMGRAVTTQQKHGVILCLQKPSYAQTPADYRPITLLNADYKLLAPIIAYCLRPVTENHLRTSQFCGVSGNKSRRWQQ